MSGKPGTHTFDATYTREWFEGHHALREEYRAVANVVHEVFGDGNRRVIDVGCGMAFILERLAELEWGVYGTDGSTHAQDLAPVSLRGRIGLVDLTAPPRQHVTRYPLVICTEVGEHLEAEYAWGLCEHLAERCEHDGFLFFSAATPGQGGNDHVNERPHEYWIGTLTALGLKLDDMRTWWMRKRLGDLCPGMSWYGRNALVFRRVR